MKRFGILCVLCLLSGILDLPVFAAGEKAAQQTAPSTMLEPARLSLLKLGEYLPRLGGLLLILVVGALTRLRARLASRAKRGIPHL
jgi:hypothetical protein